MTRFVKRGGKVWVRVFPDKPISQKPAEVRMGNGKGNPEYYVAEIQPGRHLWSLIVTIHCGPILLPGRKSPYSVCRP